MLENIIFSKGLKGPREYFTGTAWVNMLVPDKDKIFDTQAYDVKFEANARTYWHSHPGGQILFVTGGKGYYQEKGKSAKSLKKGDTVKIAPNVIHWHGAAPDSKFVHLGISSKVNEGPANWLGEVTEEEYIQAIGNSKTLIDEWDKTFALSSKVNHRKISYPNRYGILIAADIYTPKNMNSGKKYPAILVGTPYGGVKEQGAGIYAQTMAERGFVAIAFDESYNGESSGEPRHLSSPDIFVEDFSAGVDYLGTRSFVDRNKIGVIGICGSGAFALTAAQVDHRIKAVVTASMYDMSRVIRNGWQDSMTDEERNKMLNQLGEQRWNDFEAGTPFLPAGFPNKPVESVPEGLDPISSEFFEYYAMKRGNHPRSHGPFTMTSNMAFSNFSLLANIKDISPRPILFIMGESAHSRYFTEDAFEMATKPKELYIAPKARHIDLYDKVDMIPFDKIESFFKEHLR